MHANLLAFNLSTEECIEILGPPSPSRTRFVDQIRSIHVLQASILSRTTLSSIVAFQKVAPHDVIAAFEYALTCLLGTICNPPDAELIEPVIFTVLEPVVFTQSIRVFCHLFLAVLVTECLRKLPLCVGISLIGPISKTMLNRRCRA
jgi:hypothetical protein